jgi:hypothetical protein
VARVNAVHAAGGGIAAGILVNAIGAIVWAKTTVQAYEQKFGVLPSNAIPRAMVWGYLAGFTAVWLYAVFKQGDRSILRSASKAAFIVWLSAVAMSNYALWFMGLFPLSPLVFATVAGAVQVLVSTCAGAWVYEWGEAMSVSRMRSTSQTSR